MRLRSFTTERDPPARRCDGSPSAGSLQVYAKNGMNKQKASDELGISLKTLYNKLHKYKEERQRRAG